jgi:hypothetical protein
MESSDKKKRSKPEHNYSADLDIDSVLEKPLMTDLELIGEHGEGEDELVVQEDPIIGDALCEVTKEGSTADLIYSSMIAEAAEELAYLKASREAQFKGGGNFSSISEKRLKGIKTLADLVTLKNKEFANLLGAEVDFKGEGFKSIMTLFLKLVKKSMEDSNLPAQSIQTVFARLQKSLLGYEEKASRVYRGESVDNVLYDGDK